MTKNGKCCLCGGEYTYYGNNPSPFFADDIENNRCCNLCDNTKVMPARMIMMRLQNEHFEGNAKNDIVKLFKAFKEVQYQSASMLELLGQMQNDFDKLRAESEQ